MASPQPARLTGRSNVSKVGNKRSCGGGYLAESTITREASWLTSDISDQDGNKICKKNRATLFVNWWRGYNDEVGRANTAVRVHGGQVHNRKLIFLYEKQLEGADAVSKMLDRS